VVLASPCMSCCGYRPLGNWANIGQSVICGLISQGAFVNNDRDVTAEDHDRNSSSNECNRLSPYNMHFQHLCLRFTSSQNDSFLTTMTLVMVSALMM
jgi:hypothetical protein